MKARVKATGEIVEVNEFCTLKDSGERTYYWANALELITQDNPDYWTRLEHQYAGMAMQGMLSNPSITERELTTRKGIVEDAERLAHALVEQLKEKEERK